jgi:phosphate transport system substrate-binding protein
MVSPDQERIIAVDSMVVVTHPSNPVEQLSVDQLRGIFSGQITNWRQVGGPDKSITVVSRDPDSASYDFFMTYLFGDEKPNILPQAIAADDQEMSNVVYLDQNAIGFVGYAFQRGAKPVTLVNDCGIAAAPDAFSAKTEEYDLSRRMYLYNREDNLDDASRSFLNFVVSKDADGVIGKSGFIDLGISRRAQDLTDSRATQLAAEAAAYDAGFESSVVNEMLDEMAKYDRLSTTFRFKTGSSKLDERGMLDLARLIEYLEDMPSGTKVSLVGFTDSVGAFEANRNLSFGRAGAVLDEIRGNAQGRLDHVEFATAGFGEVAPSACNANDRGKAINRRVEVWISKDSAT